MEITKNMMISLSYDLKFDNAEGEMIEQATAERPMKFLYGAGLMLPKFEEKLAGLKVDDDFKMFLACKDAYGDVDEEAIVNLPRDVFLIDGKFDEEMIKEGNSVPMMSADGRRLTGMILKVDEKEVRVDFNHPLAGEDLFFSGKVIEVREATEEELAQIFSGGCSGGCCDNPEDSGCGTGSCCS